MKYDYYLDNINVCTKEIHVKVECNIDNNDKYIFQDKNIVDIKIEEGDKAISTLYSNGKLILSIIYIDFGPRKGDQSSSSHTVRRIDLSQDESDSS